MIISQITEQENSYRNFIKMMKEIDVLINDENLGFAKGNNVAYQYSKLKYNPDFIVTMNNDVEIETNNFEEKLVKYMSEKNFIYSVLIFIQRLIIFIRTQNDVHIILMMKSKN